MQSNDKTMSREEIEAFKIVNKRAVADTCDLPYRKVSRVCNGIRLNSGDSLGIDEAEVLIQAIENSASIAIAYLRGEIENAKDIN